MHPEINIFGLEIMTFPLVLFLDIYICLILLQVSKRYRSEYIFNKKLILFCMIGALIFGKMTFAMINVINLKGNVDIISLFDGFVFYGGLFGTLLGLKLFCHRHQYRYLDYSDVILSVFPLGQAIGRIGCYMNGCCYGKEYSGLIAVKYVVDGKDICVFPTWFVESFLCLGLFLILFWVVRNKYSGWYTATYLMFYAVIRFCIEFYRGDEYRGIWLGISTSQYASIAAFGLGCAIYLYARKLNSKNSLIKAI